MFKFLKWAVIFFPFVALAQNELVVEVQGVQSSTGNINVAVYNKSEGFLKFESVFLSDSTRAKKGLTQIIIHDLPSGEYALAVFHDENENNVLDTNWLGIPKEPIGFSNARMKTFGPPSFRECAFSLSSNRAVQVSL